MKLLIKTLLLLLLLSQFSCTVEKRLYNKGYHLSWNTKLKIKQDNSSDAKLIGNTDVRSELSSGSDVIPLNPPEEYYDFVGDCDTLYFRNGSYRLVTVTDTNSTTVVYNNCSLGRKYTSEIPTSKIAYISFTNGQKRVYNNFNRSVEEAKREEEQQKNEESQKEKEEADQTSDDEDVNDKGAEPKKTVDAFGLLSFIFSFLAAFFISVAIFGGGAGVGLAIASVLFVLTFAIIGINRIIKNRDRKKGLWMPIVAIGIITFALVSSLIGFLIYL